MKIQSVQSNQTFGNQYAVYERTARKGLRPLGTNKVARQTIQRLIGPIGNIQEGDGIFVFTQGAVNNDQSIITLSGHYVQGRRQEGLSHMSYDGEGQPVAIDFRRCAGPQTVQQTVLNYMKTKLGIDLIKYLV